MLKRMNIKSRIAPVLFAISCMSLFSCSSDHVDEPAGESLVTFNVALPQDEETDMSSPLSRTGDPVTPLDAEKKINSLKFFIFNGETREVYKQIDFDASGNCTDPMWNSTAKTLRISIAGGYKDIYCIANWADDASKGMPTMNESTIANQTALKDMTRSHGTSSNLTLVNPPVMVGELHQTVTGSESNLTIPLKRQIARVEFKFKLSADFAYLSPNITITGVKFKNLPPASYAINRSAGPSGTLWTQDFTGVISDPLTATATDYATLYYIPEYYPANAGVATEMIIRASYETISTYYSIVLDPATSGTGHQNYIIERNHTYQYTITIEGKGSDSSTRSVDSDSANITYNLNIK